MKWIVRFHGDFAVEFQSFANDVQDELLAKARFVEIFGPETGRPYVDTLQGSNYKNMKELRFDAADGAWRVAFAFDPRRHAILLVAGDKTGGSQKKFYKRLIEKADARFRDHLASVKAGQEAATAAPQTRAKKGKKS